MTKLYFCTHTDCLDAWCSPSDTHCRGERRIRALWSALIPPTLSPSFCIPPTRSQKREAVQRHSRAGTTAAGRHTAFRLPPAINTKSRQEQADTSCCITKPRQEVRLLKAITQHRLGEIFRIWGTSECIIDKDVECARIHSYTGSGDRMCRDYVDIST